MNIDSLSQNNGQNSFVSGLNLSGQVAVGGRKIGQNNPIFIVAEVGCNHNGDLNLAKKLVETAAELGADAVKFQKRFVNEVFIREMRDQKQTKTLEFGDTYGKYREHQELTLDEFKELKRHAEKLGVFFFVTPFDMKSVDFLEELNVDAYKISSFDLTTAPMVEKIAKLKKPVFLSTGMSSLEEMDAAIELILKHNQEIILYHCVSVYPSPVSEINLRNILTLKERYHPLPVGYSGHERGIMPTLLACAMGAVTVERHFTLDKNLPGPDHATISLNPAEFKDLVYHIRRLETALGDAEKILKPSEMRAREKHSKSIVAKTRIPAGTPIGIEMLTFKSPGTGIKPYKISQLFGKIAKVDVEEDTIVPQEALNW